jgi:hypothetical protein
VSDDDSKDVVRSLLDEVWNGRNAGAIDTHYPADTGVIAWGGERPPTSRN